MQRNNCHEWSARTVNVRWGGCLPAHGGTSRQHACPAFLPVCSVSPVPQALMSLPPCPWTELGFRCTPRRAAGFPGNGRQEAPHLLALIPHGGLAGPPPSVCCPVPGKSQPALWWPDRAPFTGTLEGGGGEEAGWNRSLVFFLCLWMNHVPTTAIRFPTLQGGWCGAAGEQSRWARPGGAGQGRSGLVSWPLPQSAASPLQPGPGLLSHRRAGFHQLSLIGKRIALIFVFLFRPARF